MLPPRSSRPPPATTSWRRRNPPPSPWSSSSSVVGRELKLRNRQLIDDDAKKETDYCYCIIAKKNVKYRKAHSRATDTVLIAILLLVLLVRSMKRVCTGEVFIDIESCSSPAGWMYTMEMNGLDPLTCCSLLHLNADTRSSQSTSNLVDNFSHKPTASLTCNLAFDLSTQHMHHGLYIC